MKYRIRIPITALAIAMLTMSAAAQSKQETEKVTSLDSTVITLAEIWSLDQGVRSDVSLYLENSRKFNLRIDSICFDKAIECIRHFGWVTDLLQPPALRSRGRTAAPRGTGSLSGQILRHIPETLPLRLRLPQIPPAACSQSGRQTAVGQPPPRYRPQSPARLPIPPTVIQNIQCLQYSPYS